MDHTIFLPIAFGGGVVGRPIPVPERSERGLAGWPWLKGIPVRWHGTKLGIRYAHSWNFALGERDGVELFPMLWGWQRIMRDGSVRDYWELSRVIPEDYAGWLIFVNEPADAGQANLSPATAAQLWRMAIARWPNAKLTSPQMLLHSGGADYFGRAMSWLGAWWALLAAHERERVEAWAFHNYLSNGNHTAVSEGWMTFCDALLGGREHWVTEWGWFDGSADKVAAVAAWYDTAVARQFYYTNQVDEVGVGNVWERVQLVGADGELTERGLGWMR